MIYAVCFTSFCMFYAQICLGYFDQGQLPTTQSFFVKARHQTWSAVGFENFQKVTHRVLGCQFLEKYRIFHFGQFLMGILEYLNYVISRHISRSTFRIYIVLYGYNLFLTSYVGLKIRKKCETLAIFAFLPFLIPLVKQ